VQQTHEENDTDRVTRLGEFSPFGRLLSLGRFFITEVNNIILMLPWRASFCYLNIRILSCRRGTVDIASASRTKGLGSNPARVKGF
jgi:hypothetical protein